MGGTAPEARSRLPGLRELIGGHVSVGEPLTPDFDVWPIAARLHTARVVETVVHARWDDGRESRFHFRWLRDGCPCPDCLHPDSREQLFDVSQLRPDIAAVEASVDEEGALAVRWNDGHESRFHAGWLRAHDYSNGVGDAARPARAATTWDASFAAGIPTFDAEGILAEDNVLPAIHRHSCRCVPRLSLSSSCVASTSATRRSTGGLLA